MTLNMAAADTDEVCQPIALVVLLNLIGICSWRIVHSRETSASQWMEVEPDLLLPYQHFHGPKHRNRHVRDCQPAQYGNVTYSIHPAHEDLDSSLPIVESRRFVENIAEYSWVSKFAYSHHLIVNNPHLTVSVLEPSEEGGCEDHRVSTVAETAEHKHCLFAINAGFFNTTSYECIGNIVSDGKEVQNSGGIQNVHFGIMKNGSIYIGYIPEDVHLEDTFYQLVGGVIWLVRDSQNYVDVSKEAECSDSQETGNLQTFIDVQSARTAIGHDKDGRVIILQVEGKSWERGANLYEMANLMIELEAVNAINLDGGGSSSIVQENILLNYPSDSCYYNNKTYGCARNVSTVICVHDIECNPKNCSNHGDCRHGVCTCHDNWAGNDCSQLQCGSNNCSGHGTCTSDGCDCYPGWVGDSCTSSCRPGTFGYMCKTNCGCVHGRYCHPESGQCYCSSGYQGFHCEEPCPYGSFGENCRGVCDCPQGCSCDHITGSCSVFSPNASMWNAGQCMAQYVVVEGKNIVLDPQDVKLWFVTLIVLCLLSLGSVVLNITLLCTKYNSGVSQEEPPRKRKYRAMYQPSRVEDTLSSSADDECSDDSFENIALRQINRSRRTTLQNMNPVPDLSHSTTQVPKSETEPNLRCMLEL